MSNEEDINGSRDNDAEAAAGCRRFLSFSLSFLTSFPVFLNLPYPSPHLTPSPSLSLSPCLSVSALPRLPTSLPQSPFPSLPR
jgi:hypothetical protein